MNDKLRHSHEPTAVDRIRDLVKGVDAQWLLDADSIKLAADLRNFYTHFDPEVEARLPAVEERRRSMHNLAVRLRVLGEIILLRHLGQSTDCIKERIEQSRRLELNVGWLPDTKPVWC